jgi:hypothetical protein
MKMGNAAEYPAIAVEPKLLITDWTSRIEIEKYLTQ